MQYCTGQSADCPKDEVAAKGTTCRPVDGTCDVEEACDGVSKDCPKDGFKPATAICRDVQGVCDKAE